MSVRVQVPSSVQMRKDHAKKRGLFVLANFMKLASNEMSKSKMAFHEVEVFSLTLL